MTVNSQLAEKGLDTKVLETNRCAFFVMNHL